MEMGQVRTQIRQTLRNAVEDTVQNEFDTLPVTHLEDTRPDAWYPVFRLETGDNRVRDTAILSPASTRVLHVLRDHGFWATTKDRGQSRVVQVRGWVRHPTNIHSGDYVYAETRNRPLRILNVYPPGEITTTHPIPVDESGVPVGEDWWQFQFEKFEQYESLLAFDPDGDAEDGDSEDDAFRYYTRRLGSESKTRTQTDQWPGDSVVVAGRSEN